MRVAAFVYRCASSWIQEEKKMDLDPRFALPGVSLGDTLSLGLSQTNAHVCKCVYSECGWVQSWALEVFLNFFNNNKLFFKIFYQVNLTGSGFFLNRTGAEIGYLLVKKCNKTIFYY